MHAFVSVRLVLQLGLALADSTGERTSWLSLPSHAGCNSSASLLRLPCTQSVCKSKSHLPYTQESSQNYVPSGSKAGTLQPENQPDFLDQFARIALRMSKLSQAMSSPLAWFCSIVSLCGSYHPAVLGG